MLAESSRGDPVPLAGRKNPMTNQPFRALIHVAVADIAIFPVSVTTSLLHLPCYNFSVTCSLLQLLHLPCHNSPVTASLLQLLCYIFRVTSSLSQLIRYIFPVATSPLHLPCYNIYRSLSHHHHFSRFHLVWLWRPC